ncbi:MAG TPA: glutamate synthase subunit beta [Fimbriimonadaceae bacterium]|jgi:glutamate synthase (NADPH/NADH) small chain
MGKTTGFTEFKRQPVGYRPSDERKLDYLEIYQSPNTEKLTDQGARCMDCGVPFCQSPTGCPLANAIPEWNHHIYMGEWAEAVKRLEHTNNFPEFTGRVCPAPCEGACVLAAVDTAVTIRDIEYAIAEYGWSNGFIQPEKAKKRTGKKISIVGSGPAGLAAAQQLARKGHAVNVFERDDLPGGLLTYGIPNMKLEKEVVFRRIRQLEAEGVQFILNANIGKNIKLEKLMKDSDAVLLALGAGKPRDLPLEGRELSGIHFAMEFLTVATKNVLANQPITAGLNARDKKVVVIGAGDTATDCIATSIRQGCASVVNLEIAPRPPDQRNSENPWPEWPKIMRTDYGHTEAIDSFGEDPRRFEVVTKRFVGNSSGVVCGVETAERPGDDLGGRVFMADLVLIAAGFVGPEEYLLSQIGLSMPPPSKDRKLYTNHANLFMAGDCRRGQSLVVWAIEEGRAAASEIHNFLS